MMRSEKGLTFYEMLVTLFIMGIFLACGVPAWKTYSERSHDQIIQNQLLQAIQFAQHESVSKNMPVALCRSGNHSNCTPDRANSLLIFTNKNKDGIIQNKEQLLAMISLNASGYFEWRSYPYYRHYLLFYPAHRISNHNDNASIWYCHNDKPSPSWAILLSKAGRTRVTYPDKNGQVMDTHGAPLICHIA
jgi:Tfp pilus assembly protein FimT